MSGARCDWCGQFMASDALVVYQPDTQISHLEPDDPQVLCQKCGREANVGSSREKSDQP